MNTSVFNLSQENSSFIISSKIPSKKKSKHAKSTEAVEIEDDCLCC